MTDVHLVDSLGWNLTWN